MSKVLTKQEKINRCRYRYIEFLTETEAVQISEDECIPCEVCIGECCHKIKEYNPECEECGYCD